MIGEVVGAERMGAAMAIDVGANNASRMLGPTIGGLVLAACRHLAAPLPSASLCYAVALYSAIRLRHRNAVAPEARGAVLARIIEGLMLARRDPRLVAILTVTVIYNVFGWPFTSMIPVIGQDSLHLGAGGIGILASMDGIGAFFGAIAIALWARPAHFTRLYIGGGADLSGAADRLCPGADAPLAGAALLLTGLSQFRVQRHAGDADLSRRAGRDAQPALWRAVGVHRLGPPRLPAYRSFGRGDRRAVGDDRERS